MIEQNWLKKVVFHTAALIVAASGCLSAQSEFDQWIDHLPYNTLNHIASLDGKTYCATDLGLLVYEDEAREYRRFSSINGLSESGITALAADSISGTLWIGYASGQLDVLTPAGIQSIADIVETPSYTGLKQINDIAFWNDRAYVATNFGIVEFEVPTRLAGRTLLLGPNFSTTQVQSIAISPAGELLAWSPDHPSQDLLFGKLTQNNPSWTSPEPAWTVTGDLDHLLWYAPESCFLFAYNDLPSGESHLFRAVPNENVPEGASKSAYSDPYGSANPAMMYQNILDLSARGSTLVVTRNFNILLRKSTSPGIYTDSTNLSGSLFLPGVLQPQCALYDPISAATYIGNRATGLLQVRNNGNRARILPNAPYSNRAYKLIPYGLGRNNSELPSPSAFNPYRGNYGGILVAPGALNDIWTRTFVADGAFRYQDQFWSHLSQDFLYGLTDFVDAQQRLTENGDTLLYLSSWGGGLVQITNGDTTAHFNTTNSGDVLKGVGGNPNDLRTGGITFDDDGTLWGVQSLVSPSLYSLSPDGTFTAHSLSPGADAVALKDIVYASGLLFVQSRTNGIYAFAPDVNGVSIRRQLRSGIGSGNLPSDKVLSLAVDHDGELWIGTDEGLVVLYTPTNLIFGGNTDARPILFEEDGVVQKLLGETPITALAVDGGNRKWIGTQGAGLFLVSQDGLQTLAQFTTANSPLLSNTIQSVAIDPTTGEVLIATDQGLIGYRGDATPAYEGSQPELTTYPNPVRPGYTGGIFISGCPEDGRVKITDVSGALVFEAEAQGGTVRWEGTNFAGTPVRSGVYLIYAMDELGEVTAQDKILIVR